MKKNIYILYDCDIWKAYESMRVHLVTTDINRMHEVIRERVAKGDYPVDGIEDVEKALILWDEIVAQGTEPSHLQDRLSYAATMVYEDGVVV